MSHQLVTTTPDATLFRVSRAERAWEWPDWAYIQGENRYDDPASNYRVLYACSQRVGAFIETLARFRVDPALVSILASIQTDDEVEDDELPAPGVVPREWLFARRIGEADIGGSYVVVSDSESLVHLRLAIAATLDEHGIDDLDGSTLRSTTTRAITQAISRYIYELTDADGKQEFNGIQYLSRLGDDLQNWGIFEPADPDTWNIIHRDSCEEIDPDDPDLHTALQRLDVTLDEE